jgi:hypothetical protein
MEQTYTRADLKGLPKKILSEEDKQSIDSSVNFIRQNVLRVAEQGQTYYFYKTQPFGEIDTRLYAIITSVVEKLKQIFLDIDIRYEKYPPHGEGSQGIYVDWS